MSYIDTVKRTTEISCINPIKKNTESLWVNPYQISFCFFIPEPVFYEIEPELGSIDAILEAKGQELGLVASLIVQAAWIIAGGPEAQPIGKILGGAISLTIGMIEKLVEDEYDEFIAVYKQAKANCSQYPYPRSSWELIHQTTWSIFPVPRLISSGWTFQGTNDPYTD